MLQIRYANRFEHLLHALVDAMSAPPASPFTGEEIIVPSAAIRRRVELAAADRFGICANVRFSFLAQWLWRQIATVVEVAETSPFTAPMLTWRVYAIFGERAFVAGHPPLAGYLRDADDLMRYDLAARTAALLEQYLTYRPDWLASWLDGKPARVRNLDAAGAADERWQGALWQRIAGDLGTDSRHPSVAFFDAMKAMGPGAPARAGLPAAAHVFCLPMMPPLYLNILRHLAQWVDLTLYVPNPCREYWFEAVDARRLSALAAKERAAHHEVGNRLLASWGQQAQAHLALLQDDGAAQVDDALFSPSAGTTLLARLQNAILDMTDLPRGSVALAANDRSVEVHVCHSLTRELEVLQDQLLALFAGPDSPRPPRPSDILVVTPDLETAAPLIDAVFGNAPAARAIPYAITGRPASVRNPCAQALLSILAAATSRFQASAVFELLQLPIVARAFGIGAAELAAIHAWMGEAGIRWGIDARHRSEFDVPAVGRHSFGDGLDRLFLGYALPASASTPLNERLGAGDPEGSAALALGSFREFIRRLTRLHDELGEPRTPGEWRQTLLGVIDNFTAPAGDEIDDERETAAAIHALHANMTHGGMSEALPADVARTALAVLLDDPTRGGIPGGAVTFAAMTSLRHLPYRFVCAIGLNDGVFPSAQRPAEFDLMARDPRLGDRQRRSDERNVFLDLLVAARERLYLSYTGRSIRDNSPIPPSVLVAELLDYAAAATDAAPCSPDSLAAARARLVVAHPLQPFSIDYFKADAPANRRSFNDEYCAALQQQLAASRAPAVPSPIAVAAAPVAGAAGGAFPDEDSPWEPQQAFFQAPLAAPGPEFREVTLDNLLRFFRNPCRYLLKARLGIVLPEGDEELQDDEPFVPDWTARTELAKRMLPRLLAGDSVADLRSTARAGVEYPMGRLGGIELDQELLRIARFADELAPLLAAPTLAPAGAMLPFILDGEPWRLAGAFGDLRGNGRIEYRYDDARAYAYLSGWLAHLFLNAMAPPGVELRTTWHSRDGSYVLPPVDDAREQLQALLALYRDGLQRPLHFFPKSAWEYVVNDASLSKASAKWHNGSGRYPGEDSDPAYRLALRGIDDPLDADFEHCAEVVFAPLLAIIHDDRLKVGA